METESTGLRLDKWLWAARFFRTRVLAAEALAGGKVKVNGERAKAAKAVKPGDELEVHIGSYEYVLEIQALSARRGPAKEAALLYEERAESKAKREALAAQLRAEKSYLRRPKGRPSKRDRREIVRMKQGGDRHR